MPSKSARRAVELIAAASLIVALFDWPHARTGWAVQIVSIVVAFSALSAPFARRTLPQKLLTAEFAENCRRERREILGILRKWPSA